MAYDILYSLFFFPVVKPTCSYPMNENSDAGIITFLIFDKKNGEIIGKLGGTQVGYYEHKREEEKNNKKKEEEKEDDD